MLRVAVASGLLLCLCAACSTAKMAYRDIRAGIKDVQDHYGCSGVKLADDAAFCVGDIYLTITVRGNWDPEL